MRPDRMKQMMAYLTRPGMAQDEMNKANIAIGRRVGYNNGQLVTPSVDGSRPGYGGDYGVGITKDSYGKFQAVISYVNNEGKKTTKYVGRFDSPLKAREARSKAIPLLEKELKLEPGTLFEDVRARTSKNELIRQFPNKKNYISIAELKTLLGDKAKDMRPASPSGLGVKDTALAKATRKLLDLTTIETEKGAKYHFYKNPTKKELDLLKSYIDVRTIRPDILERIQNIQKDKYTTKILKDGKLPMVGTGIDKVLDPKFLEYVQGKYGSLDKYVHGLVRYTQALDGQTLYGLNDPILSDGKFKTNKKLANKVRNVFLELPYGTENAQFNSIRKAVYGLAMSDITEALGNKNTTFSQFKSTIRNTLTNKYNLKGFGVEIDELIGVSSAARNKTYPYSVFTQLTTEELNQGVLKDYQKVLSNHTAKLKAEIGKSSKFVDGKWFHSKKVKEIVNNFNKNILPGLKNIDQLKGTGISLPEMTLGAPTDRTLGGVKGRLAALKKAGLDFTKFYEQEGFGYKMPKNVVTQKELVANQKLMDKQVRNVKQLLDNFWCGKKQSVAGGGRIGFTNGSGCPDSVKQKNFIALNNDVRTGRITGEAAEQIAKKTSDVVAKAGSKSVISKLLGPAGFGLDIIYEVASVGTDIYGGKSLKRAIQDNWIAGAFMPGTSQEEFHKELTAKYPEAKPYSSGLDLEQAYIKKQKEIERLKAETTYQGRAEAERRLPELKRDLEGIVAKYNALGNAMQPGTPEYENYMAAKTEFDDTAKAKAPATKAKLEMELNRPTSDRAVSYQKGEPLKINLGLPGNYTTFRPDLPPQLGGTLPAKREIDEFSKKEGYDLSPQDIDYIQKMEKWDQLFYNLENKGMGIRGTQDWRGASGGRAGYMGGGIAGIRRPNAIPPERQGLRSIMIDVNDD